MDDPHDSVKTITAECSDHPPVHARLAGPQEIGDVIAWLASSDSRWVTGQRLEASGGQNL